MKLERIPHYLQTLSANPQIYAGSKNYLFLISHMRSFSTLLSHILGSSREINGYRENHIAYKSELDLVKLRYRTHQAIEGKLNGRYVLDKILHDHWVIDEKIGQKENLMMLFTIRQPLDTVRSIINMGQKMVDEEWYLDQEKVAYYYEKRLKTMLKYASWVGERGMYLDAEVLIENPDMVVEKLSTWLKLSDPLKKEYNTFKDTGKPIHGDPSSNILEGKILKKKSAYEIDVSASLENRLNEIYQETRQKLIAYCPALT